MSALPAEVIELDHKLQKATDELPKLRWQWTLDESNPGRVSFRAYARDVGRDEARIRGDAKAYAAWRDGQGAARTGRTGAAQTIDDYRQLGKLSAERQAAAEAIARTSGGRIGTIAKKTTEIDSVVGVARDRAVERGTTVEHEIDRQAEWRENARQAAERERDARKAAKTMAYIDIEGDLAVMIQRGNSALKKAKDAGLTPELRDLLAATVGKARAIINLMDLLTTDGVQVDWDAEFEKLVK